MFDDLEVLPEDYKGKGKSAKAKERQTFPCQSCAGTGKYLGARIHQEKHHCFSCKGTGHFFTSEFDRMKARSKAKKSKADKLQTLKDAFHEANPGVYDIIVSMASWANIAASMLEQFNRKGSLTENQVSACLRIHAKAEATKAEKEAARAANDTKIDLTSIHAMFDSAAKSGLKKPAYRAEGFTLKPAKLHPGTIYVTRTDGTYLGKVVGNDFKATRDVVPEDTETLLKIAANPSQVAKDYGKRTGNCCLCGRTLTNKFSIESGIGPICESSWGF